MSKDVSEKVLRVLEESQTALKNALLKYGFEAYHQEIKKILSKLENQSKFFNIFLSQRVGIIDILNIFDDSITEIAIIISELNCWDVDYRDEIKKHLNNVQSEVFYEAIRDKLKDRIKKITAKFLDFIASNLTDSNLYKISETKAKKLSEQLFNKVDIVKKADYMAHNRWYDKDWYDATSLEGLMIKAYLFGETKKFEYLEEENNNNMLNSYAIASKSIYQMMFGTKKSGNLVNTNYKKLLKYIYAFNPGENLYALMLSCAIPALSDYRKFKNDAERINAVTDQLHEKWIGKQTKVNECVLKAMTYPIEDVGYVPGRITSTVLSKWLREYGYKVDVNKENPKKNKNEYNKNIESLKIVSGLELQDVIKKHILLIPKVLTMKLEIDMLNPTLDDNSKAKTEICQRKNKLRNFTDYLFDVIVYDENFISSLNGNPRLSNTCSFQRRLKVGKTVEKYLGDKKKEAEDCRDQCKDAIKKGEQELDELKKELEKLKKELEEHKRELEEHKREKSKSYKDLRSKKKRIIKNCNFYTESVIPIMQDRWDGLKGLGVCDEDINKSKERIQISILLIAYYLSEDFEKFDEFVKKGKFDIIEIPNEEQKICVENEYSSNGSESK